MGRPKFDFHTDPHPKGIRERLDEQRRLLLGDVRAAPRPRAAAPEAPRRPRDLLLRAARRLHEHGTRVAALDRALDDARAVLLGYIYKITRFERRRPRRRGGRTPTSRPRQAPRGAREAFANALNGK